MRRAILAAALVFTASTAHAARIIVGAGSSIDLGSSTVDLGCADLTVAGTFSGGTAELTAARHVTIQPGGTINANSATLEVAGSWVKEGIFNAGRSTVRFVDGCSLSSATITGSSSFATLEMVTSSGKTYDFLAGLTQTVTGFLRLEGAAGNLLTIRSTFPGLQAFLDLQGGHSASFVDVDDNHAIGNPIAAGEGSILGVNTTGWLLAAAVPAVPLAGLLALLLLWAGRRALTSRRASAPSNL